MEVVGRKEVWVEEKVEVSCLCFSGQHATDPDIDYRLALRT